MSNLRYTLDGDDWRLTDLVPSEWAWLRLDRPETDLHSITPPIPPWRRAIVPGDVQSDLLDAAELNEPWKDLHSREWEWTSQRDWLYYLERPSLDWGKARRATLCFEGVDYSCHIFLNGHHVGDHEGTYVPFDFDASQAIHPGEPLRLAVVVEHAPMEPDQQAQIGWTGKVRLWKPRFAYKWDWCTRLIPLGIWDHVYLDLWHDARLREVRVRTALHSPVPDCESATVRVTVTLDRETDRELTVEAILQDPEGVCVATTSVPVRPNATPIDRVSLQLSLPRPRLWWPNGYGDQPIYQLKVNLSSEELLETRQMPVGFRQVRAVPNEGASPDARFYTLEVNGTRIFLKGWNWAPINQLYGRLNEDRYRHAIRLARDAHCNLLRVWGGGLLERELFYNLCDQAGIMVWQEFPQSSSGIQNEPAKDEAYVRYTIEQARQMVPRRAHHPSLVLWCGGNELMDDQQVPCDERHPVLQALADVVREEDPDKLYLPASPSGPVFAADPKNKGRMHDVHGHWLFMGDPDHYAFYNEIDPLLHSEFGSEGTANLHALSRFLSVEYRWPPDRTNPAWVHHGAWWLHREKVEEWFGPITNLREYVFASQWLQYEGLRYAVEASRRRKWRTSGCAPWQFNESWPNTSCTNSLGYFGDLRPAYWAVRGAYAPVSVSLRYERVRWEPGGLLRAQAWINSSYGFDGHTAADKDTDAICWALWRLRPPHLVAEGQFHLPSIKEPSALLAGTIEVPLPNEEAVFGLVIKAVRSAPDGLDATGLEKRYLFSTCSAPALEPLRRLSRIPVEVSAIAQGLLRLGCPNSAEAPLVFLRADGMEGYRGPYLGWGFAPFLLPGEVVEIRVEGSGSVQVSALNADAVSLRVA